MSAPPHPGEGEGLYPCSKDVSVRRTLGQLKRLVPPVAIRVFDYPDGTWEASAVASGVPSQSSGSGSGGGKVSEEERAEHDERNDLRAVRRAKSSVRHFVRHHGLTRLLTFTNGDPAGWATPAEALADTRAFLKAHGKTLELKGPICFIVEPGGRNGRLHVHGAMRRGWRLDYSAIIETWTAFMERRGWHSSASTHRFHVGDDQGRYKAGFRDSRRAALYLCKYLSKGFAELARLKGEHRYRTCGGEVPKGEAWRAETLEDAALELGVWWGSQGFFELTDDEGAVFGFLFEGDQPRPPWHLVRGGGSKVRCTE